MSDPARSHEPPRKQKDAPVHCVKCGAYNERAADKCSACGAHLRLLCKKCQTSNLRVASRCRKCYAVLRGRPVTFKLPRFRWHPTRLVRLYTRHKRKLLAALLFVLLALGVGAAWRFI